MKRFKQGDGAELPGSQVIQTRPADPCGISSKAQLALHIYMTVNGPAVSQMYEGGNCILKNCLTFAHFLFLPIERTISCNKYYVNVQSCIVYLSEMFKLRRHGNRKLSSVRKFAADDQKERPSSEGTRVVRS